jgi:TPP-dependent pyruvate/acetoin dehydrogenase alpha subunit
VWKLPVIFVCQNNQYAEHTRFEDGTGAKKVSDRAIAYGMEGETVDGNDGPAMYAAAKRAIDRARAGDGPTLVEAMTYRFFGHINGDTMEYMPTEERDAAMAADPVPRFRASLIDAKVATETELAEVEASVEKAIDDAVEFAQNSPAPSLDELLTDVYAEVVPA